MELWKKIRIPLDKAKQILLPGAREEAGEHEAEEGGEGGGGKLQSLKALPWKRIIALILIAIGLIGTTYVAATIISQWVLVGQGPIVQGERFEITVEPIFSEFKLYYNYSFEITVKNNDINSYTVRPIFNLNLTTGGSLDDDDFVLYCNGTKSQTVEDGDHFVKVHILKDQDLDPGDSVKYVCSLKFVEESLAENNEEVKVEVALEGVS